MGKLLIAGAGPDGKTQNEGSPELDRTHDGEKICQELQELDISVGRQGTRGHKKRCSGRRHKSIDRFTLADVTPTCDIASPSYGAKGKGKRRQNRLENVKFLLSFWDKDRDDDEYIEEEPLQTIFTRVVTDENTRKIWNSFASMSGEEQDEYLRFIEQSENRRRQWTKLKPIVEEEHPAFRTDVSDTTQSKESDRNEYLLRLGADVCYRRVERHLRNAVTKKHVPLGLLEKLEDEVTTFFEKWPSSKYTSVLSSSYERLLMHALCQYLGLLSQSVDLNGGRCTQVENRKKALFHPPPISLSRYLREKLWC